MVDSAKESILNDKICSEGFLLNMELYGGLSESEIKFLSVCNDKANSSKVVKTLFDEKLTLNNYEYIFCLNDYIRIGGTINPNQAVRNIRYKDRNGVIVAVVQIDTVNKKIRMQNFGDILPKLESFRPAQIGEKLYRLANYKKWTIEDGGVNQFNGNIEYRYKDNFGNVMAAVIKKPDGTFDTIAEYEYKRGNRIQMLLTNQYGQSRVKYDGSVHVIQLTRIDVDTDGTIVEITKVYTE